MGIHDKDTKEIMDIVKLWEKNCLNPFLREFPETRPNFKTDIGLNIEKLYTPLDLSNANFN
ncbi:MAG: hypothetical protein PVG69_09100, partial [Desulfobacterales bacterium]